MMEILERIKSTLSPHWEYTQIIEEDCEECGQNPCECEEEEDGRDD